MNYENQLLHLMSEFHPDKLPQRIFPRQLRYYEKLGMASIIKGMRRTGKTFATYAKIRELVDNGVPAETIVCLNFEDERLSGMQMEHLRHINEALAQIHPETANLECWFFLDEIQNVQGWEQYARRLLDTRKIHLFLTGSSSRMLSEEIATSMRGRSFYTEVFPLSFGEYLGFNEIQVSDLKGYTTSGRGLLQKSLADYMLSGGFPDVQDLEAAPRNQALDYYLEATIYRDILERHSIANMQSFKFTMKYLMHNFARKISTRTIAGCLKAAGISANREALADYLDYLSDSYLIYRVPIRSESLAVRRVNPEKFYFIDTGLIMAESAKIEIERGMLLENMVFMALRRGTNAIEYYVSRDGLEVDFHVCDQVTKDCRLVQVSYDLSSLATLERELKALKSARTETGIEDCTIVTWGGEEDKIDGIRLVPAFRWLLEQEQNC